MCEKSSRSVQSLSRVQLFVTAWTAARQASLSITNSWSLLKLTSIEKCSKQRLKNPMPANLITQMTWTNFLKNYRNKNLNNLSRHILILHNLQKTEAKRLLLIILRCQHYPNTKISWRHYKKKLSFKHKYKVTQKNICNSQSKNVYKKLYIMINWNLFQPCMGYSN